MQNLNTVCSTMLPFWQHTFKVESLLSGCEFSENYYNNLLRTYRNLMVDFSVTDILARLQKAGSLPNKVIPVLDP